MAEPQIHQSWLEHLRGEFNQPYMQQLRSFLVERKRLGATIYPPAKQWFNALNLTPFEQVKVVILGQDPYHGKGQAQGLSFSVPNNVARPPSLQNIFKELNQDLQQENIQCNNNLENWAKQGVLLLNSVLTVEHARAGSHSNQGWELFTDKIIKKLAHTRQNIVFILWGSYAHKKIDIIPNQQHCIIKSAHPSPLSAHRGFFGSKVFSRCNSYLVSVNQPPISW